MNVRASFYACLVLFMGAASAAAQQDRAQLIQQARISADEAERRNLFVEAANPAERDSLWAVSVYEIAQLMRDLGQDVVAETWIRWVVRHGQWEIDRGYFAPSLVTFYEALAPDVSEDADPASGATATEWRWPDGFTATDLGSLEVAATDPDAALTVTVAGQDEALQPGSLLELPAGTYDLVAGAEGYESLEVQREVLPGVETVVVFDLAPIIADAVVQQVAESVVRLRYTSAGSPVCRNGVVVRDGFVVTSLSALGGANQVEVLQANAPPLGAAVVESDPAGDIAVLGVQDLNTPPLVAGQLAGPGFGWSVFRSGCDEALDVFRTRLSGEGQAGATIPLGALGSPLVDRTGSVMGLVSVGGLISPIDRVEELVEEAAAQFEGGGFPVVWIAVGAAAVGGVAALLLGGGGADTGTITITLPSG